MKDGIYKNKNQGKGFLGQLGPIVNIIKKPLLMICLVSSMVSVWGAWQIDELRLGTCISFFIAISSLMGVIFFVVKWNWPSNDTSKIPFKSKLSQVFDRVISQGQSVQLSWLAIIFVFLYVVMAGWMGTFNIFALLPPEVEGLDPLSLTFMLFTDSGTLGTTLKTNSQISGLVTLFCLGVSILGALVFTGLLISVFSNYMQRRVDDYKKGTIRYSLSNHIIFLGYDEMLMSLLHQILSCYPSDVQALVMTDLDADVVRNKLKIGNTNDSMFGNVLFYYGKRNSKKDLSQLNIDSAKEIYIIGDHYEDNHDETNIQCLNNIVEIMGSNDKCKFSQRKPVYILLEGYTRYQQSKLWWNAEKNINVIPFNVYVDWARILINSKGKDFNQIYPKMIEKNDQRIINLIVFGMGRFGRALGIEALSSLPDLYEPGGKNIQSRITFICEDARQDLEVFKVYYKSLFEQIDYKYYDFNKSDQTLEENNNVIRLPFLSFEFISCNPINSKLYSFFEKRKKENKYKLYIYACTEKDSIDSNIGLFLPSLDADIYILQRYGAAYINKLQGNRTMANRLYSFGTIDSGYNWKDAREKDNCSVAEKMLESGEQNYDKGDYESALANYQKSLEIRKMIIGEKHPDTAWNYFNIATVYYKLRDFTQSLNNFIIALNYRKSVMGGRHPMVSHCYNAIGKVYREMGIQSNNELDKKHYFNIAFINLCRALIIRKESLGKQNADTAASYNNLGNLYKSIKLYYKALDYLKESLNIRVELFKQEKISYVKVIDSKHNLGCVYMNIGNIEQAKELLLFAYVEYKEYFKERERPHPYIGMCCNNLGDLFERVREFDLAIKYYKEAHQIYISEYSKKNPQHPFILQSERNTNRVSQLLNQQLSSG